MHLEQILFRKVTGKQTGNTSDKISLELLDVTFALDAKKAFRKSINV